MFECMVVKNKKEHQRLLSILFPREFFLVCWSTRRYRAVLSIMVATKSLKAIESLKSSSSGMRCAFVNVKYILSFKVCETKKNGTYLISSFLKILLCVEMLIFFIYWVK